jgi:NADPH:quinone reductase-like Zn-dependent oxidoreductase
MRAEYGPPDGLYLADIDKPSATQRDVLVRVVAASLNAGDLDYLYGRPRLARLATGVRRPRNRRLGLDVADTSKPSAVASPVSKSATQSSVT